ncbi:hypothetical protein B0H12DRAFT_1092499 [Mycena haematopus]|nr:hypothetical protein B0H12DRAFT_1092499 [Mycena haematopus]
MRTVDGLRSAGSSHFDFGPSAEIAGSSLSGRTYAALFRMPYNFIHPLSYQPQKATFPRRLGWKSHILDKGPFGRPKNRLLVIFEGYAACSLRGPQGLSKSQLKR